SATMGGGGPAVGKGIVVTNATNRPSGVTLDAAEALVWPTLTGDVMPACKSRIKISVTPFVSSAIRSEAELSKTIHRPSGVIAGLEEGALPVRRPLALTLTSVVVPASRSRTNTSL